MGLRSCRAPREDARQGLNAKHHNRKPSLGQVALSSGTRGLGDELHGHASTCGHPSNIIWRWPCFLILLLGVFLLRRTQYDIRAPIWFLHVCVRRLRRASKNPSQCTASRWFPFRCVVSGPPTTASPRSQVVHLFCQIIYSHTWTRRCSQLFL